MEEGYILNVDFSNLNYMNKFYLGSGNEFLAPEWLHDFWPLLLILGLWSLLWKGLALWHASRNKQPWWFVIILVLNTVGILEIIYLFAIQKVKLSKLFKL